MNLDKYSKQVNRVIKDFSEEKGLSERGIKVYTL